jgi:hypothetical protein
MREFFKGWRCKAGCVVLVMAVAAMGAWIRSRAVLDHLSMPINGRNWSISSVSGVILWLSRDCATEHDQSWRWASVNMDQLDVTDAELLDTSRFMLNGLRPKQCKITYWSITIPLTLLSAYLILWKPRTKAKVSDQPPNSKINSN